VEVEGFLKGNKWNKKSIEWTMAEWKAKPATFP